MDEIPWRVIDVEKHRMKLAARGKSARVGSKGEKVTLHEPASRIRR
jgi:hypothetical protein